MELTLMALLHGTYCLRLSLSVAQVAVVAREAVPEEFPSALERA
jgi:hypothetical protein